MLGMNAIPAGTVTFLFTDIEGSTKRWEQYPRQMEAALRRHDAILRSAIEQHGGYVFKTVGDAFCAAFPTPHDALSAAVDAQHSLDAEGWPDETGQLQVRMALHTGVTEERDGDYFGQPLNRVARLLSSGHGGQVLLSNATHDLVRDALPAEVQTLDLGEHHLKDLTRPEHVFQLLAMDLPSDFPPLRTLDNHPNNLPRQATALIGREKEVEAVCSMLRRQEATLVTLTGPGGTGKTRLGLQAAAEMLEDFPDGMWFVELAALTDHNLVVSTIAQALHVTESRGRPLIESLKAYLSDKQALLVLDTFEQVAEAATQVGELISACPKVKVLVTSRVPLRIRGEKEYAVPSLSLPDPAFYSGQPLRQAPRLETLTQYEGVRLFIERATDVKSDFEVTNDNAPAVAEICVRLDGLPLAIELAAARIRSLSPQAILSRLQSRLKLLTGGAKDLPARQQTLRNTIEWSYDLLDDAEKQMFRRMAVFQGGCTLEAIGAVCNADGDLQIDVLDGVESLVSKSLLKREEATGGEPRFVMLETIHEYAREKLEDSGEAEDVRRQHAVCFLRLASEAESPLTGAEQSKWLDRLENEHDNLRAALSWARESEDAEHVDAGLRAASDILRYWTLRGYYTEAREHLRGLLAKAAQLSGSSKVSQAKALAVAGRLAVWQGDNTSARTLLERALELGRETGDKYNIALALNFLGGIEGDNKAARALYEEGLALRRELGDVAGVAGTLNNLGIMAVNEGDYKGARALYEESLGLTRALGNKAMASYTLQNLAILTYSQGDFAASRSLFDEGLALSKELGDKETICSILGSLGELATEEGDFAQASSLIEESLKMSRAMGLKGHTAGMLDGLGNIACAQGDFTRASALYEESAALFREVGELPLSLYFGGIAARQRDDYAAARALHEECLALQVERQDKKGIAESLAELGGVLIATGQIRGGTVLLAAAEQLIRSLEVMMCLACRIPYERAAAAARAQLGEDEFEKAWQEGQAMTLEQVIAYTLSENEPD
jgi:predicted ATPase/class 3 adenylate cyclase/Tfp pilus assembly protein PilF